MRRCLLAPTLAGLLVGCGTDPDKSTSGSEAWTLSPGVELVLEADGSLIVLVDGDRTFATPAGAPFLLRDVEETTEAALGMWRFDRSGQTDHTPALDSTSESDGTVTLSYSTDTGASASLTIAHSGGRTTLSIDSDTDTSAVVLQAACDDDGTFFGWGEQYGSLDRKGEAFPLLVSEQGIGRDGEAWSFDGDENTTYFPMPWYLDARGHGVLVETDHRTNVDLCLADPAVASIEVMHGAPLSVSVLHGDGPLDVIARLGEVVGRPAMPPDWAWDGAWMCAQGGTEVVGELVDSIEAAGIVASTLWVQDWTGRRENVGGGYGVQYRWVADEDELYPGIAAFFSELKGRGYRVVGYVNPFVDPILEHWDDMEAGGMLPLHPDTGEVYTFIGPRGSMTTADLTSEAARTYIKDHLRAAVVDLGLDGWMADFAEWLPLDASLASGEDAAAVHNRYPELWQELTREVMDEVRPDGDWLMYARSGWTGVHRVAMIHWNGDQEADFLEHDGLPTVVPAMLSLGMSGQPYVTHDIAGFSGGPSTKELYLRWTELGALSPFMRTHDGNERDENWRWDADAETTAHFAAMSKLHAALAPELIALGEAAQTTSAPIVRHLMLDYPDDVETYGLSDQYLLGSDLLVAPVLHEGMTERDVYLPEGTWVHVWTGDSHTGPSWVSVDAPIGEPPLFSKDVDRADLRASVE